MSRKRKKSVSTAPPKQEKKMVIDMMKVERAKANHSVGFRTGRHLTEKERPRKRDWKREYERGKGSGASNKDFTGPFLLRFLQISTVNIIYNYEMIIWKRMEVSRYI